MEKYIDDSRIHEGHRGRMRAKLLSHGQRIFDTYELLEMLLYQVIPYKDTNPIAKRLLYAFGSLEGVMSATADQLVTQNGIGSRTSEFLVDVGRLSDIIGAEILTDAGPDLSSYDSAGMYLANYFKDIAENQVVAIYLDSSMRLISFEKVYDLDYESGGVKAKSFIDGAVRNCAPVIITAHNHPHGPFYPTQGDRATNKAISDALEMSGIVHAQHYIVCGKEYSGIGLLNNFSVKLSQMPALDRFIESKNPGSSVNLSAPLPEDKAAVDSVDNGYNHYDRKYFVKLLSYVSEADAEKRAEHLLSKYHTIENVLTAGAKELSALTDEKCAFFLKLLAYITSRRKTDMYKIGGEYSRAQLADYLKALFLGDSVEKTYLIGFDARGRFLGCELLGEGTVSSSEILPRKALDVSHSLRAKSVSIAHNHPFGVTRASIDDMAVTNHFATLFGNCDIKLIDHFIVAGQLCDTVEI